MTRAIRGFNNLVENANKLKLRSYSSLKLEQVKPAGYQPRHGLDENLVSDLIASFREDGQLQPILVVFEDGIYKILEGHHRYEAAKALDWIEIEAIIVPTDTPEAKRREYAVITNVQRKDLDPWELAKSLAELKELHNHTLESLGNVIGKKKSSVEDILRINNLPEYFAEDFRRAGNKISTAMIVEIAREKDPKKQELLWNTVKSGQVTSRNQLRDLKGNKSKKKKPKESTRSIKEKLMSEGRSVVKRINEVEKEEIVFSVEEYDELLNIHGSIGSFLETLSKQVEK